MTTNKAETATLRDRFQTAAWSKAGWERSDRDRPEMLDRWAGWCRAYAVDDMDTVLAALDRIAALAPLRTHAAGSYTRRSGETELREARVTCSACHQPWPRAVVIATETCGGCIARTLAEVTDAHH